MSGEGQEAHLLVGMAHTKAERQGLSPEQRPTPFSPSVGYVWGIGGPLSAMRISQMGKLRPTKVR